MPASQMSDVRRIGRLAHRTAGSLGLKCAISRRYSMLCFLRKASVKCRFAEQAPAAGLWRAAAKDPKEVCFGIATGEVWVLHL